MICKKCGAGPFPNLAAVRQHHRDVHGLTSGGNTGGSPSGAPPRPTVRQRSGSRRIEDVTGGSDAPLDPAGTGPDAGPVPRSDPRPSRPSVNAPIIRVTPEHTAVGVREAVRDALPLPMLRDLIHTLSVAVSEADGAGPAGYLSEIQSTQVASLLYDATVDLVVDRFKGDVTRFKAALAVVIILVSKGRVHGAAVRDRLRERQARSQHDAILRDSAEERELTPVEAAMARQGAMQIGNDEAIG